MTYSVGGRVNEGSTIYVLSKFVLLYLNDLLAFCFLYSTSICFQFLTHVLVVIFHFTYKKKKFVMLFYMRN